MVRVVPGVASGGLARVGPELRVRVPPGVTFRSRVLTLAPHGHRPDLFTMSLVATEVLRIEAEIAGPPAGRPVLLLHGWPDARDVVAFVEDDRGRMSARRAN